MADLNEADEAKVRRVELLISNLLRIGVVTSFAIIVLGIIVTFTRHHDYFASPQQLARLTSPGAEFPHSIHDVLVGVRRLHGQGIVVLGLLLLIATPIMRVGVSIFAFVYQHDKKFIIITSIVFALLLLSFLLGKAE